MVIGTASLILVTTIGLTGKQYLLNQSAIIAIVVSSLVGILFGTVPAIRAAQFDPVESLRYE